MGCQANGWGTSGRIVLQVVCLVSLWASLVAAQPPPPASPCRSSSRHWITTVWGFVVTLVVLTVDVWGKFKNEDLGNRIWNGIETLVTSTLNPIIYPLEWLAITVESRRMANRVGGLYPAAKAYVKILLGCEYVVVSLSPDAHRSLSHLPTFKYPDVDLSDALVIGSPVGTGTNVTLTLEGKEALVRADVLPPPEQLKILQGYSGLAQAISALQAVGYMWGIGVRISQHLEVSPIEAIAFSLNIVILLKAFMHYYLSSCHRPLLLYLDAIEESKFTSMCEKQVKIEEKVASYLFWISLFGILEGWSFIYFIVTISKSNPFITVVPLIIVGFMGLVLSWIFVFKEVMEGHVLIDREASVFEFWVLLVIAIGNSGGYILGLILTIKYWKSLGFHIESSSDLSQFLPYIG